jgi:hypothetical protein
MSFGEKEKTAIEPHAMRSRHSSTKLHAEIKTDTDLDFWEFLIIENRKAVNDTALPWLIIYENQSLLEGIPVSADSLINTVKQTINPSIGIFNTNVF